jgi:hypothetical protein
MISISFEYGSAFYANISLLGAATQFHFIFVNLPEGATLIGPSPIFFETFGYPKNKTT